MHCFHDSPVQDVAGAGPDVFERAVAAQQLAWCVRRVGYKGLGALVGFALPVVMAAAEDVSPAVQRQGLWALHHLATGTW